MGDWGAWGERRFVTGSQERRFKLQVGPQEAWCCEGIAASACTGAACRQAGIPGQHAVLPGPAGHAPASQAQLTIRLLRMPSWKAKLALRARHAVLSISPENPTLKAPPSKCRHAKRTVIMRSRRPARSCASCCRSEVRAAAFATYSSTAVGGKDRGGGEVGCSWAAASASRWARKEHHAARNVCTAPPTVTKMSARAAHGAPPCIAQQIPRCHCPPERATQSSCSPTAVSRLTPTLWAWQLPASVRHGTPAGGAARVWEGRMKDSNGTSRV